MSRLRNIYLFNLRIIIPLILSLVFSIVVNAKNNIGEPNKFPEVETLQYECMNTIVRLINHTDHNLIYPQFYLKYLEKTFKEDLLYEIEIYNYDNRSLTNKIKSTSFYNTGSYLILVVEQTCSIGENDNLFKYNGLQFHTSQNLSPFFRSCKREKIIYQFDYKCIPYRFWRFEIRNGRVLNAFYYYEENDYDVDSNLIYDLLNKEMMRYGDWKEKYPYLKEII